MPGLGFPNVKLASGNISVTTEPTGAKNLATSQVTASGSAATLAVARPTRTSVAFYNTDATNGVYIGPATVTSGNGTFLPAGSGQSFTWTGLFQVIASAGSPVINVADEYN